MIDAATVVEYLPFKMREKFLKTWDTRRHALELIATWDPRITAAAPHHAIETMIRIAKAGLEESVPLEEIGK